MLTRSSTRWQCNNVETPRAFNKAGSVGSTARPEDSAVSIALLVTRPGTAIALSEWMAIVDEDAALRLRREPYVAFNPRTGEKISINPGNADAEIQINGKWLSFLRFRNGALTTKYVQQFDDPQNAMRVKITAIAHRLGALIRTDAGDEFLSWY
jgi:hypothetical protein